jgi:hypothetical protein
MLRRLSELLQFVMMTQHCQFIKFIRKRLSALRCVISNILGDGCAQDANETSAEMYEALKHQFSTRMTRVYPKSEFNKKAQAYEISTASEASNINVFSFHAEYFVHLRRIYSCLCDAVEIVNSMFGFVGMFLIIQIFTELITGVNGIMHLIKETPPHYFADPTPIIVHTISRIILSLGMLVNTIVCCHVTVLESKELGTEVQKLLLKYPLRSDTVQQLKLFSFQISSNGVQFTAFWLFNLDISFLCTIFASSITYIILLAQLK